MQPELSVGQETTSASNTASQSSSGEDTRLQILDITRIAAQSPVTNQLNVPSLQVLAPGAAISKTLSHN